MTKFSNRDFSRIQAGPEEVSQFLNNASRDITIADQSKVPEVIFDFMYKGLIKTGIALFAHFGYRVSSKAGHHIKIIGKLSEILNDKDIDTMGNLMRSKRNQDLYAGGVIISKKEVEEYAQFVKKCYNRVEKLINDDESE